MKKIIALVLCLLMVFSLVACGSGSAPAKEETAPAASTEKTEDSAAPAASSDLADSSSSAFGDDSQDEVVNTVEQGLYNPDYDYSQNKRFKICYYLLNTSGLSEEQSKGFTHWCSVMNMEYGGIIAMNGDKDAYLSNLNTLAAEYDGLIIDPDAEAYGRVSEILDELGTPWMGLMSIARDYAQEGAPMVHPYVGFVQTEVGKMMANQLIAIKEKMWPDVPMDEFGFISVDYVVSPPLHERGVGFHDQLEALDPAYVSEDRYFVADCSIGSYDVDTASQVVSAVLAEHSDIEYWLCFGDIDDMTMGAAVAFDNVGLADNCACVTFGGTNLQQQWDAGITSSWVAACYLPPIIYNEPIIGALYLFMTGEATPEDIWPEWKDDAEPAYAKRMLPAYWIYQDNYQHLIEWSDVYSGADFYDYDATGITRNDFSTHVDVPEYYHAS